MVYYTSFSNWCNFFWINRCTNVNYFTSNCVNIWSITETLNSFDSHKNEPEVTDFWKWCVLIEFVLFHQNSYICDFSSFFDINWKKLVASFCKSRNLQLSSFRSQRVFCNKAPVRHDHITILNTLQKSGIFHSKFITRSTTISVRNVNNGTLRWGSNQIFSRLVMFIIGRYYVWLAVFIFEHIASLVAKFLIWRPIGIGLVL